jgi:hypothetical protein
MEGVIFPNQVLGSHGNIEQDEFDKIWPMLHVLARSSPNDELRLSLVYCNRILNHIVRNLWRSLVMAHQH